MRGDELLDMALLARTKAYLLEPVLMLRHGLPSHDTFSRVFRMLDPEAFERSFQRFLTAFAKAAKIKRPRGVVAVDGKALRRGYERGKAHMSPVMVTLWAAQTHMARANTLGPGQQRNPWRSAAHRADPAQGLRGNRRCLALPPHHSQEDRRARRGLCLGGEGQSAGSAARCQVAIAAAKHKGAKPVATSELNHGRAEKRSAVVAVVKEMGQKHDFLGLKAVACITSKRGEDDTVSRYFLMSQTLQPQPDPAHRAPALGYRKLPALATRCRAR